MIRVAVCDDNKVYLNQINRKIIEMIQKGGRLAKVDIYASGMRLLEQSAYDICKYDIIILDIDMPEINGKDLAKKLREVDRHFKLIFLTSMDHEVYNSFQYNVSSFVPKSAGDARLESELSRIAEEIDREESECLWLEVDNERGDYRILRIPMRDIMYAESANREIYLHNYNRTFLLSKKHKFETLLSGYEQFYKIHRTCILNLDYLHLVEKDDVVLKDGEKLPLSRRQRAELMEKLREMVKREVKGE